MKSKEILRSYVRFKIRVYAANVLFDFAQQEKIELVNTEKINDYEYSFEVRYHDFKKIQNRFKELEILEKRGPRFILNNLLKKKTTLIALIISIVFFYYLSTLIIGININGTSSVLNEQILTSLNEKGIARFTSMPSISYLQDIQGELYNQYHDDVERLEITKNGNFIEVTYVRRRQSDDKEQRYGKLYAKKDGVIDKIEIGSGVVLVTSNQYVSKGTLLVDDTISLNEEHHYVIGTYGKIYAYTWSIVTLELEHNYQEESELLSYLLNCAQYEVSKNFSDDERIDVQEILVFKNIDNKALLKVHFTLYENIILYQ